MTSKGEAMLKVNKNGMRLAVLASFHAAEKRCAATGKMAVNDATLAGIVLYTSGEDLDLAERRARVLLETIAAIRAEEQEPVTRAPFAEMSVCGGGE